MKQTQIVMLKNGIVRGGKTFNEITIRKALVPQLKGLSLFELYRLGADEWRALLPKISAPKLTKADFDTMTIADFTALMNAGLELIQENEDEEYEDDEGEKKSDLSPSA